MILAILLLLRHWTKVQWEHLSNVAKNRLVLIVVVPILVVGAWQLDKLDIKEFKSSSHQATEGRALENAGMPFGITNLKISDRRFSNLQSVVPR